MRPRMRFDRTMVRPLIYQTFTRGLVALTAILIVREFSGAQDGRRILPWGCMAAAGVYLLLAWVAWLRLDGALLPALDHRLFRFRRRRDPFASAGMADHIDDRPVSFEELEPEQRDLCLLAANAIVAVAFAVAGMLL